MQPMDLARDELAAGVMAHLLSKQWAGKAAGALRDAVAATSI